MQRLEGEGVRGADLVFACVGPALEIYSRYSRVETAEGREVALPEYLERVWEVVGREALEQVLGTAEARARNGAAGALEEDSRLTALFLWTMQSTAESEARRRLPLPVTTPGRVHPDDLDDQSDAGRRRGRDAPQARHPDTACPSTWRAGLRSPWASTSTTGSRVSSRPRRAWCGLLPVSERGKQLFGESGVAAAADELDTASNASPQLSLFPEDASCRCAGTGAAAWKFSDGDG